MARSVLVTGGTGTLGQAVVRRLYERGETVRVLSRRAPTSCAEDRIEVVTGDLTTGAGLAEAIAGVDSIVHCATTLSKKDIPATENLISAVRDSGASPHLIYISIVGVDKVPLYYYRAKLKTEGLIEESDVPWTVLRATQFHDLVTRVWTAERWSPVLFAPSKISFQPIDVRDVAKRLGELVEAGPSGRVGDIGGPQVRTASDLARAYLAHEDRRRPVVGFPVPTKVGAGYRAGAHMVPDKPFGTITYEEFLAEKA